MYIFETYTRYSGVDHEEQKNKVLGVFLGSFEIFTRYSRVDDNSKKRS